MNSHVKWMGGRLSREMGVVKEQTWTTIAADIDGVVQEDQIGKQKLTRECYFAFKREALDWYHEQIREGFSNDGFSNDPCVPAATSFFGESDSPSNCWVVRVYKEL